MKLEILNENWIKVINLSEETFKLLSSYFRKINNYETNKSTMLINVKQEGIIEVLKYLIREIKKSLNGAKNFINGVLINVVYYELMFKRFIELIKELDNQINELLSSLNFERFLKEEIKGNIDQITKWIFKDKIIVGNKEKIEF